MSFDSTNIAQDSNEDSTYPKFVTLQQAVQFCCGLKVKSIRRLLDAGKLTEFRLNRKILIDRDQLLRLIQSSKVQPQRGKGRRRKTTGDGEPVNDASNGHTEAQ